MVARRPRPVNGAAPERMDSRGVPAAHGQALTAGRGGGPNVHEPQPPQRMLALHVTNGAQPPPNSPLHGPTQPSS
jgi:hypothetical protein